VVTRGSAWVLSRNFYRIILIRIFCLAPEMFSEAMLLLNSFMGNLEIKLIRD